MQAGRAAGMEEALINGHVRQLIAGCSANGDFCAERGGQAGWLSRPDARSALRSGADRTSPLAVVNPSVGFKYKNCVESLFIR